MIPDDLIPVVEAAALAGVHHRTLRQWIRAGKLAGYVRAGTRLFVSRSDVEALYRPRAIEKPVTLPPSAKALEVRRKHTHEVLRRAGFAGY